jgi:hypothetical protein
MPEPRRRRPAEPSVANLPVPQTLQAMLQPLHDLMRTRQYTVLGRMTVASILRDGGRVNTIDFRREAPTIAVANESDQLLMVTPWPGIPPKWSESTDFCQSCIAKCDVCVDGKKACEGFQCGGRGTIPLPVELCDGPGCTKTMGKFNPSCTQCNGTGNVQKFADCPVCQGTGKMTCGSCRGTGERPTGVQDGNHSSADFRKPACNACKGSRFAHHDIPVNINEFVNAREGSMLFLGPVIRFVLDPVEGGIPQVFDVEPDSQNNGMVIALTSDAPGCEAYILGGVLKQSTRVR